MAVVTDHGESRIGPLAERVTPGSSVDVPRPIRVKRQQIVKAGELERAVELAARRAGVNDGILILLDADSDCPADLTPVRRQRIPDPQYPRASKWRFITVLYSRPPKR